MASHHVTWVTKDSVHGHIMKIGGSTGSWTPEQARTAMATGEVFYTQSPMTGKIALIEGDTCSCGEDTVRSAAYAEADNTLDVLPDGP
jgi:hypothetical protein